MSTTDKERIEAIKGRVDAAVQTDEHTKRQRFGDGSGTMYREIAGGWADGTLPAYVDRLARRNLLLDCYNEGDREFYFSAVEDTRFLLSQISALTEELTALRASLPARRDA